MRRREFGRLLAPLLLLLLASLASPTTDNNAHVRQEEGRGRPTSGGGQASVLQKLAEKDPSVREEKEEEDFEEADNAWTTASRLRSQNLHKTIAAALKPDKPGMEQYDFMSAHLTDADLKKRLRPPA